MSEPISSYWPLIEPLFSAVDTGNGGQAFAATSAQVARSAVLLYAAHMSLSEVHNGGFLQLFWNNTGVLVPEAIEGFNTIGMARTAELMAKAALLLGSPYPRERDDRWDALLVASGRDSKELEPLFEKTDNLFVAFVEATNTLPFDSLNDEFWDSATSENGGFQDAATQYAQVVRVVQ